MKKRTNELKQSLVDGMTKEPQPGKVSHLKMLWMVLAVAAFWWLGSSGGETTVFRKVVATLFGWKMDLVFEVLGAIAMILLGITFVALASHVMNVPRMNLLTDPATMSPTPTPRDALEAELQSLGFRFIGDFDAAMSVVSSMRIRAYTDPDGLYGAVLMDGKSGSERATILEFSTRLKPSGSIVTNNSPYPAISSYPPDKCVSRVPWKKTAAAVLELHKALCRTAVEEKFTTELFSAINFTGEVIKATRKDMEYQVETGRYRKVGEDQYRMSLWGVVIAVPRLWLNMTYSFLFSWYRPPVAFFCWRVRQRLHFFNSLAEEKSIQAQSENEASEDPESTPEAINAKEREAPTVKM